MCSSVSVTVPVASAVAVRTAGPAVAVQAPATATSAVAPAATAPVAPSRVRPATVSRVTEPAGAGEVPRLCTETVNDTEAPTAGAAGLVLMPVTSRSGPGLCATVSFWEAVRLLLVSSSSGTVSVGSTTADTV